ncbi:hypothetical protein [Thermus phage TSP4]|nr:hypothetical protein [Thermus phage TSP4]
MTVDWTITRGMRAGLIVPDAEGEVVLQMVSPQDGFPLLRAYGERGVVVLGPEITGMLAFKVADYYIWDEDRTLLQQGRVYVRGPYPAAMESSDWQLFRFTGRGPHPVPQAPQLVFVNGVLYLEYEMLDGRLYIPDAGVDDEVVAVLPSVY